MKKVEKKQAEKLANGVVGYTCVLEQGTTTRRALGSIPIMKIVTFRPSGRVNWSNWTSVQVTAGCTD